MSHLLRPRWVLNPRGYRRLGSFKNEGPNQASTHHQPQTQPPTYPHTHQPRSPSTFRESILEFPSRTIIRIRLISIANYLEGPKQLVHRLDRNERARIHSICDDLLHICSEKYPTNLRRKALTLLLVLMKFVDARSTILLESNFITSLGNCKLELCHDPVVDKVSAEILCAYEQYRKMPCKCHICRANLRSKLRLWDDETVALYAFFRDRTRFLITRNVLDSIFTL